MPRAPCQRFIGKRKGDRVGLVVFGDSLPLSLTLDYDRVNRTLDELVNDGSRNEEGLCQNGCHKRRSYSYR